MIRKGCLVSAYVTNITKPTLKKKCYLYKEIKRRVMIVFSLLFINPGF